MGDQSGAKPGSIESKPLCATCGVQHSNEKPCKQTARFLEHVINTDTLEDKEKKLQLAASINKQGATMDSYLAVSSNDMLSHLALPKSPETLCGKIVVSKANSRLECDICKTLSGGVDFVKTNSQDGELHDNEGSFIEQSFGLDRDGSPHIASLDDIDEDDEILLKAIAIVASQDENDTSIDEILEARRTRERAWRERNEEHSQSALDADPIGGEALAPVQFTNTKDELERINTPIDPTLNSLVSAPINDPNSGPRIRKIDGTDAGVVAARLRALQGLLEGTAVQKEDIEKIKTGLSAVSPILRDVSYSCKFCSDPHSDPPKLVFHEPTKKGIPGARSLESCPVYKQIASGVDAAAELANKQEESDRQEHGEDRFQDAIARVHDKILTSRTKCVNCGHERDSHVGDDVGSNHQRHNEECGGDARCEGSEECPCRPATDNEGPNEFKSNRAPVYHYFRDTNRQLASNNDVTRTHLQLINSLSNDGHITPQEQNNAIEIIHSRTAPFGEGDPVASVVLHKILNNIHGGASVDAATARGVGDNLARDARVAAEAQGVGEGLETPGGPRIKKTIPTAPCEGCNNNGPKGSTCISCNHVIGTQIQAPALGQAASSLRQSSAKTATNWTLDGIPIEDGFTLMTPEEANGIPFLDLNKVSISNKIHCSGCDTDQWLPRVSSCMQCNELKCLDCMDDILNEFVGSCKKCANIDENEESYYLSIDGDSTDLGYQQFVATLDEDYISDDSFLPYYDN